jgi:hypothetical protein
VTGNALYYGDNLAVLRDSIATESVDLVYLEGVMYFFGARA